MEMTYSPYWPALWFHTCGGCLEAAVQSTDVLVNKTGSSWQLCATGCHQHQVGGSMGQLSQHRQPVRGICSSFPFHSLPACSGMCNLPMRSRRSSWSNVTWNFSLSRASSFLQTWVSMQWDIKVGLKVAEHDLDPFFPPCRAILLSSRFISLLLVEVFGCTAGYK